MKSSALRKRYLSLLFIWGSMLFVSAQIEPQCGTVATPESEKYFKNLLPQIQQFEQEFYQRANFRSSSALSSVPIKAHILRDDSGSGGLTETQLNDAISVMNTYYANAYIEFFLCDGINYINSSEFFDFTTDEQDALTNPNNVDNVINIYFANTVSTTEGGGLCGYAYFPGGPEVILMANSCATNGSTLSHEMGHFFALSHTHGNTNGALTTELVDGSNCDTDGDFICDTPADPQLGFNNVSTACTYVGSATDANGDFFAPNELNIMSYSRKSCRTEFSEQQYARIYGVYQASRFDMACPSFNLRIASNFDRDCDPTLDVEFSDISFGATSWQWDVDGDDIIDYTTQNVSHTYTTSGQYDVALTASNGSNTITKVFENYIEVGSEAISTNEIVLTLTTDDWANETSWELKDSNDSVLYASPTYTSDDDFQTFTYNFTVSTNECYTFEIADSYGDGICCFSGTGSYTLTTLEGNPIASGGDYSFGEVTYMSNAVLSVEDYFTDTNISVYPNPTKNTLNIQVSNSNDLPDSYTIYNVLGQHIMSKTIINESDLSIETKNFSEGVYYIKLEKGTVSNTIPFIKN
ncbi:T9SS type A sorting domain-containing protein [Psychroserpens sp. SPM9]|uniref:zinc-dependent metalloprotease n=1 Tax=Psychroserpens sp. SPM9 TaxID=2975598 RepID=UPI0021A60DAA|nr:T9SS type A sorting domain-containing protein [Psychroserpens sp. SPM9]MDG5492991.1 T9SS type A sorting domain-containing protein [Psychroserpens sp. SPM9]